jgi:hypothetical protein
MLVFKEPKANSQEPLSRRLSSAMQLVVSSFLVFRPAWGLRGAFPDDIFSRASLALSSMWVSVGVRGLGG